MSARRGVSVMLHGTEDAERHHRIEGTWPCQWCTRVRADVARQLRVAPLPPSLAGALVELEHRPVWCEHTGPERLELLRECVRAARDVTQLAHLTGLPLHLAHAVWLDQPALARAA